MPCNHIKIRIEGIVLTSNPPGYPWVCEKCGTRGVDSGLESVEFKNFKEEYNKMKKD